MLALPLVIALLSDPLVVEEPSTSIHDEVREVSAPLLGKPYRRSPLGEGEGIDPDPRFRLDAFDCLTLVETAIALAHGASEEEALAILDDIRYAAGEDRSFQSRLHIMEAQWLPEMMRKGYLEEVTPLYGGGETQWISIQLDEARWSSRRILRDLSWRPSLAGTFEIPILPLSKAAKLADSLPEGLVIDVVREERQGTITRISHTGLIVVRDGKRFVRHASLNKREVVDEPLDRFITRHGWMRKWPVVGFHLSAIRDNRSRTAALLRDDTPTLVQQAASE